MNKALAMAWFALAAERGEKKYVDARELAYAENERRGVHARE